MNRITIALVGALLASTASAAGMAQPSFDCAKASVHVEHMICSSEKLAKIDATFSVNYSRIKASNIGKDARAELVRSQREWVRVRNACQTSTCIERQYDQRNEDVCGYPVLSGVHPTCEDVNVTAP